MKTAVRRGPVSDRSGDLGLQATILVGRDRTALAGAHATGESADDKGHGGKGDEAGQDPLHGDSLRRRCFEVAGRRIRCQDQVCLDVLGLQR